MSQRGRSRDRQRRRARAQRLLAEVSTAELCQEVVSRLGVRGEGSVKLHVKEGFFTSCDRVIHLRVDDEGAASGSGEKASGHARSGEGVAAGRSNERA